MPTVRAIMREAGANDYRFSELVRGIIHSDQFTKRVKSSGESVAALNTPEA
jgi:hypothetical protein